MKKIVIIGASYLQQPLIDKVHEMGYEAHVFAWQCGDAGEKTADRFYPISIVEKEKILEVCREIKPDAVCTISTDLGAVTANYVANSLGLASNSPDTAVLASNKYEMRRALQTAGLDVPAFLKLQIGESVEAALALRFPIIVKPTDRSGSRGVIKLDSPEGVAEAIGYACNSSFEKCAIVEEYIEGREYSCETASFHGDHHIIAVTKKYTTGAPFFIETGHIQPSDLLPEQLTLVGNTVKRALDALRITDGISHAEFMINDNNEVKIIEVGARMGGDCIGSHLVRLSTGVDFVKAAIAISLGREPELDIRETNVAAIRYIMSDKDVEKLEYVRKNYPQYLYEESVDHDEVNDKVTDSSNRHGFFILCGTDREQIRRVLDLD